MSGNAFTDDPGDAPTVRGLEPGQAVGTGRYQLKRILGQGGMGIVWLAFDSRLSEEVALKFLPPQIRFDPTALDDLRRETLRSRKLTHANIMRIHDLFEAERQDPFISMEYVDGPTLSTVRLQQPGRILDWDYLARLVKQLCEALDYAHGEKVIHRDLKPANLMLDARGRIKLADFGIARVVTDSMSRVTQRNSTSGTLVYMSPQQLDGKTAHPTDDVYSLGATLYELMSSKPPFYTGDIAHQIRYIAPEPISQRLADFALSRDVPEAVEETVQACLAKNPTERPQSAREVAERIGLLDARTPVAKTRSKKTTRRSTTAELPATPARKKSVPAMAIGGAVLVLAAAGWYFGIHRPGSKDNGPSAGASQSNAMVQVTPPPGIVTRTNIVTMTNVVPMTNVVTTTNIVPATNVVTITNVVPVTNVVTLAPVPPAVVEKKYPQAGQPWTNNLGMIFLPVPGTAALFSRWETRVQDYETFVKSHRHTNDFKWQNPGPGFAQTPLHAVVNVNWNDAKAFCEWLTAQERKSGLLQPDQSYRLPTDIEWSLAVGLKDEAAKTPKARSERVKKFYPWGTTWPPTTRAGNFPGKEVEGQLGLPAIPGLRDEYPRTAPVGTFQPNALGLYDLGGNAWEWCQDLFDPTETGRVLRGGAWDTAEPTELLASFRNNLGPLLRRPSAGFRCVLEVGKPAAEEAP